MIGWTNLSLNDSVEVQVREDKGHPFVLYLGGTEMLTGATFMLTKEMFETLVFQCHSALHEYDVINQDAEV
jgi:hypothetical protein